MEPCLSNEQQRWEVNDSDKTLMKLCDSLFFFRLSRFALIAGQIINNQNIRIFHGCESHHDPREIIVSYHEAFRAGLPSPVGSES